MNNLLAIEYDYQINQQSFLCKDCNLEICLFCYKTCHKEHNVQEGKGSNKFKCSCALNPNKLSFCLKICTARCHPEAYQIFIRCITCHQDVCQFCINKCHKGHKRSRGFILNSIKMQINSNFMKNFKLKNFFLNKLFFFRYNIQKKRNIIFII